MRSQTMLVAGAALLLGLVLPGRAVAVGASPGVILGSPGASWQGHPQRFEAVPGGLGTLITEVPAAGGAALASRSVPGRFGIPAVAYDGSAERLPATSATLVLAAVTTAALPRHTGFVVLSTRNLRVLRRFTLPGAFAFDALSPDGRTLYLTEHRSASHITRYRVRAYDLRAGRLLPGVIADRSTGEWRMDGIPATRLQTAGGGWAYTLYQGGEAGAFVHALDTRTRTAHCIDLPGMQTRNVMAMRLRLTDGGSRLLIRSGARTAAAVDTRSFRIARAVPAPPRTSSSSSSALVIGLAGAAILLVAAAGAARLRWRIQHNPAHGGRS
jgi:hypothetical protein